MAPTIPAHPVRRRSAIALAALLTCLAAAAPVGAFELQDERGERLNLLERTGDGRWALVMLWSTDCIPCELQKPMIDAFHAAHADTGAHVVGVALDGPGMLGEIERIKALSPTRFPTLVAFDDVFARQFQELTGQPFRATPSYLLFKPDGALLGVHVGPIAREALEAVVSGS